MNAIVFNIPEDLPVDLQKPRIFLDRRRGLCMIAETEGEDWLYERVNDNWVTQRKITDSERATVEALFPA